MEKYQLFDELLVKNSNKFKEIIKDKNIRLVSHLDSDGICFASIMIKSLIRLETPYSLSIVTQLKESVLKEMENEKYDVFIFTDLGSGQLDLIDKYLPNKTIFILDHHETKNYISNNKNLFHINPHLVGVDGSKEISGSGVVYKFCEKLNKKNQDMSHIAIIGAIGDVQENNGFSELNNEILQTAINNNKIVVEKGLKFFGLQTKPLYKVLTYCTDPVIPGVSGDDNKAISFMNSIGVNPHIGTKPRKFFNLTLEEKEKLISGLIIQRSGEENPEDILGNVYYISGEEDGGPTRDAREFSTLLNACGRLNRASIGIGACLNDLKMKKKAVSTLRDYKREIVNALKWYDANKNNSNKISKGENYIIIRPDNEVLPTIIGTLSSIVSRNKDISPNTYIMSLTEQDDFSIKVSIRIANCDNKNLNVKEIVEKITDNIGGQSGGHKFAAGAIIDPEIEDDFIKTAINIFNELSKEELVINNIH